VKSARRVGEFAEAAGRAARSTVAREEHPAMLGSRGHGGFAGLLLGSVSASLAHHTPCPLVIVPPADRA
jgi:hypothetical protein